MSDSVIHFAEFLASLWVIVGSVWLLYQGIVYIMAAMTEAGMPADEKRFSPFLAWMIAFGELAFLAAVALYIWIAAG